jgi:AraC family transcriptional activator of tynA and feaB
MDTWSTDTVRPSDGFSFWHDVVCQAVLNVATEARPDRFRARISGHSFGALRFAAFDSTSHEIVRSRAHVTRAPADNYLVSLQRHGSSMISQGEERFVLEPGEIAILDGQLPFRVAFPGPVSRAIAVVPRKTLDARAPWLRRAPVRKIAAESPFADLARRHLLQLAASESLGESEANLLTDNLCNLLALASARDAPSSRGVQVEALLAFCRQQLGNPDLSPQLAAARFGVSLRTVHMRFEQVGQSFGRWVLDNRLEGGGKALRDPHQFGSSISEIAWRWGFNDLSHFTRSFRARFGMSPREWRKGRLSAGQRPPSGE